MDVYEKLSRVLMRRKYEKVDRSMSLGRSQGYMVKRRTVTVKVPEKRGFKQLGRAERKENLVESAATKPTTLPIVNPKLFTILSSGNDVVDEAWLREALRRVLDDGRVDILTKGLPQ